MALPDHEIVQLARGSNESVVAYTGPAGELIANTDNWNLHLQDGVTAGGRVLLSLSFGNSAYQPKSNDLVAMAAFDPTAKGFLTRRAQGNYALRNFAVGGDGALSVTNPGGYAGDVTYGLNGTIPGARTFSGAVSFSGGAAGIWTGSVVGGVTGATIGTHTGPQVGDVDVRGKSFQLDDGQIAQSKINGLTAALAGLAGQVQPGMIMMWAGDESDVPAGWWLCDGDNGTPDLSDKFIVSHGPTRPAHTTAGSDSHSHTTTAAADGVHSHGVTTSGFTLLDIHMPTHTHLAFGSSSSNSNTNIDSTHVAAREKTVAGDSDYRMTTDNANVANTGLTSQAGGSQPHNHTASSADAGSHTHTMTTSPTTQVPAFYSLAFIMKGV